MRFVTLEPADVVVGRGVLAQAVRVPYRAAVRESDAGRVDLERGERATTAKRLLASAGRLEGKRIRMSYLPDEHAIVWKTWATTRDGASLD